MSCAVEGCGEDKSRGHPRTGWVQVHVAASEERRWYCSWRCVIRRGMEEGALSGIGSLAAPMLVERTEHGLRMRSQLLPGWCRVARGPHDIARAIDNFWVEVDIARYAFTHGAVPDREMTEE